MIHPLTGVQADGWPSEAPALAVKIDNNNTRSLPQIGLEAADIVYETHIENGVTRFLAIFHSHVPETIGMIRSARSSDIDLVSNLNVPYLAYWGANEGVGAEVRGAEDSGSFVALNAEAWPTNIFFYRDPVCDPRCGGLLDTPQLQDWAKGTPPVPVFDYGNISASAKPVAGVRWTTTNRQIDFVWDHASTRWLRFQDGVPLLDASGMQLGADNVVLLYVIYTQSAADPRSPEAISIGRGGGKLFRQGTERPIVWDRPIASDGWHLAESQTRKVATLTPGTTWVGLLKAGEMRLLTAAEVAVLTG
jgi:hypothetical protein